MMDGMDARLMSRANRAQFADVSLRHVNEDEDIEEVSMPTVQGRTDGGEPIRHRRLWSFTGCLER
jgi:hypothetical protein